MSLRVAKEQYMLRNGIRSVSEADKVISEKTNISVPSLRLLQSANNIPSHTTIKRLVDSPLFSFDLSAMTSFVSSANLIGKKVSSIKKFNQMIEVVKCKFSDSKDLIHCLSLFEMTDYESTYDENEFVKEFLQEKKVPHQLIRYLTGKDSNKEETQNIRNIKGLNVQDTDEIESSMFNCLRVSSKVKELLIPLEKTLTLKGQLSLRNNIVRYINSSPFNMNHPLSVSAYFEKIKVSVENEARFSINSANVFDFRNYLTITDSLTKSQKSIMKRLLAGFQVSQITPKCNFFTARNPIIVKIPPSLIGASAIFKYLQIFEGLNISVIFDSELSVLHLRESMIEEKIEDIIVLPLTSSHRYFKETSKFHYVPVQQMPRGTHGLVKPIQRGNGRPCHLDKTPFITLGQTTAKSYFEKLSHIGVISSKQLSEEKVSQLYAENVISIFDDGCGIAAFFPFDRLLGEMGLGERLLLDNLEVSSIETILFAKRYLGDSQGFTQELQYWVMKAINQLKEPKILDLIVYSLFCDNDFSDVMANAVSKLCGLNAYSHQQ